MLTYGTHIQKIFKDLSFKETYDKVSFKEDVVNSILEWMNENSISQEDLAKKIDSDSIQLSKLFSGEEEITLSFLSELHVLGYRMPAYTKLDGE